MEPFSAYLIEKFKLANYPTFREDLAYFFISIAVGIACYFIIKYFVLRYIEKFTQKSSTKLDDILLHHGVVENVLFLFPIFLIFILIKDVVLIQTFVNKILYIVVIIQMLRIVFRLGNSFQEILFERDRIKFKNIKMFLQIFNMLLTIIGILLIATVLLDSSILKILSGIGAMAAVLMLIFKDTILSFSASIHISMNNLVDIGDWIQMPSYGVDGDVVDISLNNVKVQNFDKSIVSIPKLKFLDNSFVNWKGMQQAGGRRIKRAILIDHTAVKFCDENLLEKLKKVEVLSDFLKHKLAEIEGYNSQITSDELINKRALTNIGVLRFYIEHYLKNHHGIKKDFTLMVRQLDPTEKGLPLEIYCFTNTTNWAIYESIQADVFDHILAVLNYFDLRVFQLPSGNDFRRK